LDSFEVSVFEKVKSILLGAVLVAEILEKLLAHLRVLKVGV
jgi:hypothetical protein